MKQEESMIVVQCQICCNQFEESQLAAICFCCQFKYCIECFTKNITSQIDSYKIPVCFDENQMQEQLFLPLLSLETKQRYNRVKLIKILQNASLAQCPRQCNINGVLFETKEGFYVCNWCETKFCKTCRQQKHQGDCDLVALQILVKNLGYSICQKCERAVQKNTGCNHISCRCGYHFCYVCWDQFSGGHLCKPLQAQSKTKKIKEIQKKLSQRKEVSNQIIINQIYNEVSSQKEQEQQPLPANIILRLFWVSKRVSKIIMKCSNCSKGAMLRKAINAFLVVIYMIFIFFPLATMILGLTILFMSLNMTLGLLIFVWVQFIWMCKWRTQNKYWRFCTYIIVTVTLFFTLAYPYMLMRYILIDRDMVHDLRNILNLNFKEILIIKHIGQRIRDICKEK